MKKTIKLILVLVWLLILWAVVYASTTVANDRMEFISKLPWNGSWWWTYDSAHDVWPWAAWDVARFNGNLWVGNIITDTRTGLMWESIPNSWSNTMNWDNAKAQCANLTVWWYTDWRLPNIVELESIIDYSQTDGANYSYASKFTLEATYYWSSTTDAAITTFARYLDFYDVIAYSSLKTLGNFNVICTR